MPNGCTVVITTKDRWIELDTAIASVVKQRVPHNVVVVDDGSAEPMPGWLAEKYPNVKFLRNQTSLGIIQARNAVGFIVEADFIATLDDDAEYVDENVLDEALSLFEDRRVGAVSIPHVDIINGERFERRQPTNDGLVAQFVGCANVVRHELFTKLNGFRGLYYRQGEEEDFCIRLLSNGYFVATAKRVGVWHRPSPRRNLAEIDYFGPRNKVIGNFLNYGYFLAIPLVFLELGRVLVRGMRRRRIQDAFLGWLAGIKELPSVIRNREHIPLRVIVRFELLKRGLYRVRPSEITSQR